VIIAIDFDGTVVVEDHRVPYDDTETPLRFERNAREALLGLKRAGHLLLLWSARASHALRFDPTKDALVRAGAKTVDPKMWAQSQSVNEARYQQMLAFVAAELPGVFDAIDDGSVGKPLVDLFIDNKALSFGAGSHRVSWSEITSVYGEEDQP